MLTTVSFEGGCSLEIAHIGTEDQIALREISEACELVVEAFANLGATIAKTFTNAFCWAAEQTAAGHPGPEGAAQTKVD